MAAKIAKYGMEMQTTCDCWKLKSFYQAHYSRGIRNDFGINMLISTIIVLHKLQYFRHTVEKARQREQNFA